MFLYILYFGLVGGVIFFAFRLWQKYMHRFLYFLFIYIGLFYGYIFLSYNGRAFAKLLSDSNYNLIITYLINAIVTTPLLLISIYFLVKWEADLLGIKLHKIFKFGFWTVQFLLMAFLFTLFITFISSRSEESILPYIKALGYSISIMLLFSYLFLVFGSRIIEKKRRRILSRNLGIIYLWILFIQFLLSDILRMPFYEDVILNNMFMFGMLFLLNLVPLVYLYFYLKKHHLDLGFSIPDLNGINRSLMDYGLTDREKEIIELIIAGMSNKDIGRKLFISIKTVKNHISSIYLKTSVKNRVQLSNFIRSFNSHCQYKEKSK